jgi:hypothetical protein
MNEVIKEMVKVRWTHKKQKNERRARCETKVKNKKKKKRRGVLLDIIQLAFISRL